MPVPVPDVVVAGPILARSPEEAERLVRSALALSRCGSHPLVLADGGSLDGFVARLRALDTPDTDGVSVESAFDCPLKLVSQVQRALTTAVAAGEQEWVLYTEPDKQWFFENRLLDFLNANAFPPEPGIAVPMRDAASFVCGRPWAEAPARVIDARLRGQGWAVSSPSPRCRRRPT